MLTQTALEHLNQDRAAFVLFGPTASGKTGLSLALAKAFNAEIINIDSRQFYQEMPIISAMPTAEEFAQAEHKLFDFLAPDKPYDVMQYLKDAKKAAEQIWAKGKIPLFVGGTGFYIKTLIEGISPIPEVKQEIVTTLNARVAEEGVEALYQELLLKDPDWAAQIEVQDKQRIIRGLAVYAQTGQSLSAWQKRPKEGALCANFINIALMPEREILYNRINNRYANMVSTGLVAEMEALKNKGYSKDLPALSSIGIPEYFAYLDGEKTLDQAHEEVAAKQRQYAKRQCTWLRRQYNADMMLTTAEPKEAIETITTYIKNHKGY